MSLGPDPAASKLIRPSIRASSGASRSGTEGTGGIVQLKRTLARIAYFLVHLPVALWCLLALWFDGPSNPWLGGAALSAYVVAVGVVLWRVRPFRRMAAAACAPTLCIVLWWMTIPPRQDRDWQPEVARLPAAEFHDNRVTVHNVRNFEYRTPTDFDERWETREYDLNEVRGFDMFLSNWGPEAIAHTIASWEFADGRHLAVSIETRKEKGESYSAIRGFFRQFEIYYVVADERDVVGLRAAHRGERVSLYRIAQSPEVARALLVDYLDEIDRLAERPEWYNALTANCTTTIRRHAKNVGAAKGWDWRILANGRIDEMAYEREMIDTSLPFEELRARSDITDRAKAAMSEADFSARIREGLPGAR